MPSLDSYHVGGGRFLFPNWNNWLSRLTQRLPVNAGQPFYFAPMTVRMFAVRQGRHSTSVQSSLPIVPGFKPWPFGRTIRATIEAWPEKPECLPEPRLTLGIIAARHGWQDVIDLCVDLAGHAAEAIVVLDTDDSVLGARLEEELRGVLTKAGGMRPRVIAHPLSADFAAQRNRIQQAARTDWVLQLDCDERLTPVTKEGLSGIIDDAEREGWDAIAFPRRNLVDGVMSALYPDVQYRLLRRSIAFTRAVHEYPLIDQFRRSFVHLGGGIIHSLASERLKRREVLYEKILDEAGRPHDTALLRLPLEAGIMLPE